MRGREVRNFGRYELLTELARGGMAELHLAHLVGVGGFERMLAIKRMLPHISQDRQYVEMFMNEGRIAARLNHPNVCLVYELGEERGQLFLAMEYLEGVSWETLSQMMPDEPREHVRIIAGVIAQACDGLHYAHQLRDVDGEPTPVIHRDVSPQNLFLTVDGVCKVLDFGVAKMMTEGARTRSGVIKGKLPYMSPEQICGDRVDARSDGFAIGVVLWEAFTGEPLFHRATDYQIWRSVTEDEIPPVTGFGPDIEALVARALERDPAQRFQTAADLAQALRQAAIPFGGAASNAELATLTRTRCADQLAARTREVASAIAKLRGRAPSAADTIETDAAATASMELRAASVAIEHPRRRRWPIVVIAAAGLAVAATLVVTLGGSRAPAQKPIETAAVTPEQRSPPTDAHVEVAVETTAIAAPPDAGVPRATKRTAKRPDPKQEPKPDPKQAPKPDPKQAPKQEPIDARPGTLTVDSKPFARIFIDGKQLTGQQGETPAFHIPLAAGHHRIRLVLEDHRERTLDVQVAPGEDVNLGTIQWPRSDSLRSQ